MRTMLHTFPCVIDGRVIVDVRGPWPLAMIGMCCKQIETRDDFINFIIENLD